ncbi:MAG: glycosyltransferase family 2 protein [Simkaniaceae bacterium]|nr:glycosyltransferase family 2 protein [Simkaniaceae bacterium]
MPSIRLSVIMANYNHGRFLEDRISSILSQMALNDEFIIVDDASTDNSISILEKFAFLDSRFKFIKNKKNAGTVHSINIAAQAAQGIYLTGLGADDRILPNFIDKTIAMLLNHPEIGICCSDCALIYDGYPDKSIDQIYTTRLIENIHKPTVFSAAEIMRVFRTTTFWIPGHTSIMKRELLLKYGGFQDSLGPFCDWFLNHAIALNTGIGYIPEELSIWRITQKGYSQQLTSNQTIQNEFHFNVLKLFSKKEFRSLLPLFKKSWLLHSHTRPNLRAICFKPQYWHFFIPFIQKYFSIRWKKYLSLNRIKSGHGLR